ncbi:unnamed protein product, partial [Closterium sp. NIES-54]
VTPEESQSLQITSTLSSPANSFPFLPLSFFPVISFPIHAPMQVTPEEARSFEVTVALSSPAKAFPFLSPFLSCDHLYFPPHVPPMQVTPEEAQSFEVTVILSSPANAFPAVTRGFNISFCSAGEFLNATSLTCQDCLVGHW